MQTVPLHLKLRLLVVLSNSDSLTAKVFQDAGSKARPLAVPFMMAQDERRKLLVGLDFGTTHTGKPSWSHG